MAVKCFLMFFLFWFHPSFTCLDTLFNIYIYFFFFFFFLPACWVVGGILIRKRGALTPRHSLFQKLQLKYTGSLVGRFKMPLDISTVDNTLDGFG